MEARDIHTRLWNKGGQGSVLTEHGIVAADTLNSQMARVLLMLALTVTREPAEIEPTFATC